MKAANFERAGARNSSELLNRSRTGIIPLVVALVATCSAFGVSVRLAWDPNPASEGVTAYHVYFFEQSGSTTNRISASTTNATVSNLQPNRTYTFLVTAVNEAGESDPSEPLTYTVPNQSGIEVSWVPSTSPALASYTIYFGEVNTPGTNRNVGTATEYSPTNLPAGAIYFFTARAFDSAGNPLTQYEIVTNTIPEASPFLAINLRAVPQAPQVVLNSPTNTASFINPAAVTFAAQATDADGTVAQVDFYSGTNLIFSSTAPPYGGTVITNLLPGQHAISAVALDNSGLTARSAEAWITVRPPIPAAPTNFRLVETTSSAANLAWNDASTNEAGFRLYRSAGGAYTKVADIAAGQTSFQDQNLTPDTAYSFKIVAFNETGESSGPTLAARTLPLPPAAPANLTANSVLNSYIQLSWQDMSNNEESFVLERSTNGTTFAPLATLQPNVTNYTDRNLVPATAYYYRVRAVNKGGFAVSNVATAKLI
jgi:fibronectin type 3 domain-containing protein